MQAQQTRREKHERILESIDLLTLLSKEHRQTLADNLQTLYFKDGDYIVQQATKTKNKVNQV
jgi:flagellin-specific chaperone FliS